MPFIPAIKTKENIPYKVPSSGFVPAVNKQEATPISPPINMDEAWSKPKTYTDIAQGIQDNFAGSGVETLKRATAVPDDTKFSWKKLGQGLLNPKTYIQALKDTGNLIHGLAQAGRSDIAFVPKGIYNLAKDLVTGEFGKEGDAAFQHPTLGNNGSTLDRLNAGSESFLTDLTKTAPLYALTDITENLPDNTNKIPGMKQVNSALENRYVKQNAEQWSAPVKANKPGYSKAIDIYNEAGTRGNNIGEVLTKNKIDIDANIEGGKYSTAETADKIRTDAGQMSRDVLRPSLQKADHFTPRTPVEEVVNSTIADIRNSRGITALDEEAQIAQAQAQGEALTRKYPNGMSLTDMHDNQISYAKNGGYNFGDTPETGNIKATNRAYGRSLNKLLENKSPDGISVKEFKKELAKQYQAADYLEALDKKTVPQTVMQKVAKTTSKVVGASVGHSMGGGVLGGIGGYHIGGMIESLFENIPNPVKAQFLNNLRITNPQAFSAIYQFMADSLKNEINLKALPTSSVTSVSNQNKTGTSPAGQGTVFSQSRTYAEPKVEVLPAQEQIYRAKSGQMKKGYTSQSGERIYSKAKEGTQTLKDNNLSEEAMKYKNAEEFVKAHAEYSHGGSSEITKFDARKLTQGGELGKGIYFSGDESKAGLYGGSITKLKADLKNPLVITKSELWSDGGLIDKFNKDPNYTKTLIQQGHDGILVKNGNLIDQGVVFDPKKVLTKSQLTEIWNKAHQK